MGEWQLRVTWFVAGASSSGLVPGGRAGGGWEEEWDMSTVSLSCFCFLFYKSRDLLGIFLFLRVISHLTDPRGIGYKDWVEPLHTVGG